MVPGRGFAVGRVHGGLADRGTGAERLETELEWLL